MEVKRQRKGKPLSNPFVDSVGYSIKQLAFMPKHVHVLNSVSNTHAGLGVSKTLNTKNYNLEHAKYRICCLHHVMYSHTTRDFITVMVDANFGDHAPSLNPLISYFIRRVNPTQTKTVFVGYSPLAACKQ